MVTAGDFQDFTQASSRLMLPVAQSPLLSVAAGWQSVVCDVPPWVRSLNLLVSGSSNVISLSVTGGTTSFTYLNAMPAVDGGIYYIPVMPVIDTQVTVKWYQVAATSVSIYVVASDEPISISVFNAVTPALSITEHLTYTSPLTIAANAQGFINITPDITTKAVRCTVDNPSNVLWAKVVGNTTGVVYFDGTAGSTSFPTTPIPINALTDVTVKITVQTKVAGGVNLYVAAINVPDFSGGLGLSNPMSPSQLLPDPKQSDIPNQLPAIYDGTIAGNASAVMTGAVAGIQYRVHAIAVTQYTSVVTAFDLIDTNNNKFFHYHYSAAANSMVVPLFGQLADKGTGLSLHNTTGLLSGAIGVTLWYSVL